MTDPDRATAAIAEALPQGIAAGERRLRPLLDRPDAILCRATAASCGVGRTPADAGCAGGASRCRAPHRRMPVQRGRRRLFARPVRSNRHRALNVLRFMVNSASKTGIAMPMDESVFASLTPRERECLRGVRALKGSGQIARDLGIATGTVDAYIGTAKVKLGARDRKHAAMLFAEHEGRFGQTAEPDPQKMAYQNLGLVGPAAARPFDAAIGSDRSLGLLHDVAIDQRRFGGIPGRPSWRDIFREIVEGARPSDLSITTRGALILAATVIIGFAFFAVSAGVGALYGLATLLKSLSH